MHHWIFPTEKNNYRAKLIATPAISLLMVALVLVNTILGTVPAKSVFADITSGDLLELHNEERGKAGLGALTYSSVLSNSAQKKAEAMLRADCWSHYCPEGKSPWDFFEDAGYEYIYAGENLAEGFYDTSEAMVAWMNSQTHKQNVLRSEYTEIGFGIVQGTFQGVPNTFVVAVHFGTPRKTTAQQSDGPANANLPTPEITQPTDGAFLNADSVEVEGTALSADKVILYEAGKQWVVADADQGIFTYKSAFLPEGNYSISAQSVQGLTSSSVSKSIKFAVDRTPNQIDTNDIDLISGADGRTLLQVSQANLRSITLELNGNVLGLQQKSPSLWEVEIDQSTLQQDPNLTAQTIDLAGNTWSGSFETGSLVANLNPTTPEDSSAAVLKSQINFGVLVILLILFGIDFVALLRSGQTHASKARTNFHFALLIVIGVLIASGSLTGQVGQGINF